MIERVGTKLLIIIAVILVAFILSSFSLYRLYLRHNVITPHAGRKLAYQGRVEDGGWANGSGRQRFQAVALDAEPEVSSAIRKGLSLNGVARCRRSYEPAGPG